MKFTLAWLKEHLDTAATAAEIGERLTMTGLEVEAIEDKGKEFAPFRNARAGMIGVFAPAGTHIPGTGIDLAKGVIRGVESNGMLLSERELGISEDHAGIVDLPADAPVGQPYA